MILKGKKILIGITGSIAAYKIPVLIRLLKKEDAEVQVVMTPNAKNFVTPLTLATLSQNPALTDGFDPQNGKWNSHIELGSWADAMLFAPLSANSLAKMANGLADNLLLTVYLAARCPVFFAPAMDVDMYLHPATQENINKLQSIGNILIAPKEGELASGLCGAGRMEEPEAIVEILKSFFQSKQDFVSKKILITAGPTYENIDPVRFISNYSTGTMGYALAEEFASRGADVVLISGPTNKKVNNRGINQICVTSAKEMYDVCNNLYKDYQIIIMAAAVADFTPKKVSKIKIKKDNSISFIIECESTKDILQHLTKEKEEGQFFVGFALETDNEEFNALKKLKEKNLDIIILNSLKDKGAGFGISTNKITIFDANGNSTRFELKTKKEVAKDIANEINKLIKK